MPSQEFAERHPLAADHHIEVLAFSANLQRMARACLRHFEANAHPPLFVAWDLETRPQ